jgi:hypothetical protein
MLAGAAGGAIISNIPDYESFKSYSEEKNLPVLWWKNYYLSKVGKDRAWGVLAGFNLFGDRVPVLS